MAFRVFAFLTRFPGLVNRLARISRHFLPLAKRSDRSCRASERLDDFA